MEAGQAEVTRGATASNWANMSRFVHRGAAGIGASKSHRSASFADAAEYGIEGRRPIPSPPFWSSVGRRCRKRKAYHLQISPSVMLSSFVVDKKFPDRRPSPVSGLDEGIYYWMVSAIDAKGVESQPSQANRLNLVQEVAGNQAYLEVITNYIPARQSGGGAGKDRAGLHRDYQQRASFLDFTRRDVPGLYPALCTPARTKSRSPRKTAKAIPIRFERPS